mmetsp:Transcript_19181/g.26924  ORF Transcript_19181/g.26924 Transcript_19181/m.26924 type:complete len:277 (+) Transcript_19181:38-868(+)
MSWDDEDNDWENNARSDEETTDKGGAVNAAMWDDEDASDNGEGIGEEWDAEEKPKEEEKKPEPKKPAVAKKKTIKQIAMEKEEAERAKARAAGKVHGQFKELTLAERRRAEEQADLALSADLFGNEAPVPQDAKPNEDNQDMAATGPLPDVGEKKAGIKDYVLKTEKDYQEFAKEISAKVNEKGTQKQLLAFLKELLASSTKKMNSFDFNEVKKITNVIGNEKAKAVSNKKAVKGGSKKTQLSMKNKGDDWGDDWGGGGGGRGKGKGFDSNDYDFI